jgi:enoyl-CoA hydratase
MEYQNLILEKDKGILHLTINREDKLNALNERTMEELEAAFQQVYDDPAIKLVIITGKGSKAFVAGADIKEISSLNPLNGRKFAERGQEIFAKIESSPKPVIAAINGYALGGGCELAMACHIRIASENAFFGLPEVNLGIIPGFGGTQRLPMLVGKAKAFELIMTGTKIDAQEAHRIGLANHVVAPEELMDRTMKMAQLIISKASVAIAQVIDSVNASSSLSSENGYQTEANSFGSCLNTEDFKEGTTAFLQKRKPVFSGS